MWLAKFEDVRSLMFVTIKYGASGQVGNEIATAFGVIEFCSSCTKLNSNTNGHFFYIGTYSGNRMMIIIGECLAKILHPIV